MEREKRSIKQISYFQPTELTLQELKTTLTILFLMIASTTLSSQEEEVKKIVLDIGGALRYNYNLSSWKPNQIKRGGDLGYEMFRINVDAIYDKWELHIDQRFYSQAFGGAFLKYGYIQYNTTDNNAFRLGLIPSYFGTQQFNSHSWFFQLPFYLGFEDDHDMGISYGFDNDKHQVDLAFYKNAETLSFADNAPVSDSRYSYDFAGDNKEINQFTLRYNYKLEKHGEHKIGATLQYGGIWNIPTEDIGFQSALGLHYDGNFKNWNLKAQFLAYNNRAVGEPDAIEMTAYGAPYLTAARASIYSVSLAYTFPINWGPVTTLQVYNDYSYMAKANDWEATQMNVLGAYVSAQPFYVYIDFARGLHHPWLGPEWTHALADSDPSVGWEFRFNINFGLYF